MWAAANNLITRIELQGRTYAWNENFYNFEVYNMANVIGIKTQQLLQCQGFLLPPACPMWEIHWDLPKMKMLSLLHIFHFIAPLNSEGKQ